MKSYFYSIAIVLLIASCSSPRKEKAENKTEENEMSEARKPIGGPSKDSEGDEYKLVLKYIDNRAVIHVNDSVIYDSKTVYGSFDLEIYLTDFVNAGKTDLKVDVYNGEMPYNTASPEWKIVYDIYINDELVEFVAEGSKDGALGLVHTETHDLADIW